jgi:hypothetical protein
MASSRNNHSIALVLGTIHRIIDYVYLLFRNGNRRAGKLEALQTEQ